MLLPKLNEFGNDATVSGWMVAVGDSITIDMPVINMEMEKAEVEVCSTVAGKVIRQLVRKGDVVKVGQAILEVE
jgi:pyruvate/2-oxoglutarate dehydrogenase complex dihydrolipoamide acyltransferase (E2) component